MHVQSYADSLMDLRHNANTMHTYNDRGKWNNLLQSTYACGAFTMHYIISQRHFTVRRISDRSAKQAQPSLIVWGQQLDPAMVAAAIASTH